MVTVVVIYALCWLPLHSVTLAGDTDPAVWTYRHIQVVWIASHWLAMSHCCYNPFVYFWMSSNFRSAFRRLRDGALCRRRDDGTAPAVYMSPTTRKDLGVVGRSTGDRRTVRFADSDDRELTDLSVTPRLTQRCMEVRRSNVWLHVIADIQLELCMMNRTGGVWTRLLPRDAMYKRRLCHDALSAHGMSATLVYCIKMSKHNVNFFPTRDSPTVIFFLPEILWRHSDGVRPYPLTGVEYRLDMRKSQRSTNISLYLGNNTR